MNTKKFIVRSKEGAKQVEIPTEEGKNDAKENINQGDVAVEATDENEIDNNYEVDQRGWKGGGGGGWKGGGGRGGGGGGWKGGGRKGGGGRGGGGSWGAAELETEEVNNPFYDEKWGWGGGWPWGWRGGWGGGWPWGWRGGWGGGWPWGWWGGGW